MCGAIITKIKGESNLLNFRLSWSAGKKSFLFSQDPRTSTTVREISLGTLRLALSLIRFFFAIFPQSGAWSKATLRQLRIKIGLFFLMITHDTSSLVPTTRKVRLSIIMKSWWLLSASMSSWYEFQVRYKRAWCSTLQAKHNTKTKRNKSQIMKSPLQQ